MDIKDNKLFMKILKTSRSSEIDYYLICNFDAIKKALSINVSKKQIYDTIIKEGNFSISYSNFTRKLKNINKYIIDGHSIEKTTPIGDNKILSDKIFAQKTSDEPKIIGSNKKKFQYDSNKS